MLVAYSASGAQEVIGQAKRKKILLAAMGGAIFTRTQTNTNQMESAQENNHDEL